MAFWRGFQSVSFGCDYVNLPRLEVDFKYLYFIDDIDYDLKAVMRKFKNLLLSENISFVQKN